MCGLDPGGLRFREMQQILKVLVHHVDHAVAAAPQQEERCDEKEGGRVRAAIGRAEKKRCPASPLFLDSRHAGRG